MKIEKIEAIEARITVGTTSTSAGTTLGFGPISTLEEAWKEEFRREDFRLSLGYFADPDDGCWTIVLIGGDGGENLERDLDHPADRVPTISQIVEALDLDLTGPCEVVVELGFVERYADRGPLQMEVEFRPVA